MSETKNSSPFFSVVLTTRNRAALLPFAVKSVLAQSYQDFEIIISDNFSTDTTPEVARNFNDPRISYVRTPESLPMNESYRFALGHARGEYITFLSDDDAFTVGMLERAKSIIEEKGTELLCWKHAYYYLNDYKSEERPLSHPLRNVAKNSLVIPTFSSRLFEVDSQQLLKQSLLSDSKPPESLVTPEPRGALLTNAAYHRGLLQRLKEQGLELFRRNVIPDIYAAFVTGLLAKKYLFLDEPLTVFCIHGQSATAHYAAEKTSLANQFEVASGREHELLTPIKSFLNRNYHLNTILQAQRDVGDDGNGAELNRKNYFLTYHAEMLSYRERGLNVDEESRQFDEVLAGEPERLQEEVRSSLSVSRDSTLRSAVRKLPRPSLVTKWAVRLLPKTLHQRSLLVRGEDAGFADIAECGAWLDAERIKQLAEFCLSSFEGRPTQLPFKWRVG